MKAVLKAFLLLVGMAVALGVLMFMWIDSRGISAQAEPGRIETVVARTMRRLAMPRAARDLKNPVARSPDVVSEGMAHYADHCAACHANDGSGETEIGLALYPKPPDLRLPATQSLTDGELFHIIENGIRLSGMPAWAGSHEGTDSTWHLIHFIRELPRLTPQQIDEMKTLNPRSPDDTHQEMDGQKAHGSDAAQAKPPTTPHKH
jgi:mono/diheme cytochrome c family protein